MRKIILAFVLLAVITIYAFPAFVFAQYSPSDDNKIVNINFPCPASDIGGTCSGGEETDFIGYIKRLYQFGIAIAGILAVGMIIAGGIYISATTGSIDKGGQGKEMITSAIWGIVLLFGTYLILNTINPELVKLRPPDVDDGAFSSASSSLSVGLNKNCAPLEQIQYASREDPGYGNGCLYRKAVTKNNIVLDDRDYYNFWVNAWDIPKDSMVWSYPYFIKEPKNEPGKSSPTSTARCIIYAYKEPATDAEVENVTLSSGITACTIQDRQITSQQGDISAQSESAIRQELASVGITINKSACANPATDRNCTTMAGMPSNAVSFLKQITESCVSTTRGGIGSFGTGPGATRTEGCSVQVTGGTETATHVSHGPGKPIFDIVPTGTTSWETLGEYLKNSPQVYKICTMDRDPDKNYRKNCGDYNEPTRHYHVQLIEFATSH